MGVCASLARFFGIDAVFVRVLWVLICLFPPVSSFMAIAAYILLGYIIPEETDYIDV
jgi:phage shock protein PspC (stress-responsive transcriptional regulator)